jgi:HemY protein
MISLLIRFVLLVALAAAFAWLADQPGDLKLRWLGYEIETSLMAATITLFGVALILWIIWSILMWVLDRPGAFGGWFKSRRQKKGREALSSGLIAVAAGDKDAAQGHAKTAAAIMGDDPMVKLLDAQAAQMRGDNARVKQLFEEMAERPETRLLGLRGLHTEARRQSDMTRARALAEEAARINPKVSWASQAVLSYQSVSEDWLAIGKTIDDQRSAKLIDKTTANQKRAVVLTAQAQDADGKNSDDAETLALKAHNLDPSLVPAALIAARHAVLSGSLRKASKIIEKTWSQSPHPELAEAYAHLRAGDSAQDRLKRVKSLVSKSGGIEAAVALAVAAIEALEWKTARDALTPFAHDRPQARICGLMAEIEEGEFGDKGRAREWLARAVRAPRDPAWTADGFISRTWLPVSPVSGELGVFKWKVPVEGIAYEDPGLVATPEDDDVVPGDDAIPVAADESDGLIDELDDQVAEDVSPVVEEVETVVEIPAEIDNELEEPAETDTEIEPEASVAEEVQDKAGEKAGDAASDPETIIRQPDDPGPASGKNSKKSKAWL